ncbi:MAG: DUF6056 family protein [Chloroflexi bacterium]|nr:DUF6056 family protein [Chloroflexota bacterium]
MPARGLAARVLGLLALAGLGAPLAATAVGGLFSRYAADDYCTAGQVQLAGFFEAQSRLYVGWSGRFAATLPVTALELIGPPAVPFLPAAGLVAWVASVAWTARALVVALGWRLPVVSAGVVATLLVFGTLQMTADAPQDLYWQTGLLTYLWPLILATLYAGWVAHVAHTGRAPWASALGVSFALALIGGGTSETFAAAQVTALALACGMAYAPEGQSGPRSRHVGPTLLTGLLGALVALAIVGLAPGNTVRQETGTQTPLSIALPHAVEFTWGWLRLTFARPHAVVLLLLVGLPFAYGAAHIRGTELTVRSLLVRLGVGVVITGLIVLASMLPAFYALGSNPPGRAQVIPQYVVVCSLAGLGWLLGAASAPRLRTIRGRTTTGWVGVAALLVLLVLGPLATAREAWQQVVPSRTYAAAWDQLDSQVRAERTQGVRDVTVRPLPSSGLVHNLDFVGPDRQDWFNGCVARYYGVDTIASTLSVP